MVQEIVTRNLKEDKEIYEFMLKIERDPHRRNIMHRRLNQINRELKFLK